MFQFLVLAAFFFPSAIAWEPCVVGTVSEVAFRRLAIRKVMPVFPDDAITAKAQGVAVAKVRLDEKGEISSVEILQAPHESIARATADAKKLGVLLQFKKGGKTYLHQRQTNFLLCR